MKGRGMDPLFSQSALKGNAVLYPLTMRIKKTSLKIYDMISNWLSCFYFVSKDLLKCSFVGQMLVLGFPFGVCAAFYFVTHASWNGPEFHSDKIRPCTTNPFDSALSESREAPPTCHSILGHLITFFFSVWTEDLDKITSLNLNLNQAKRLE